MSLNLTLVTTKFLVCVTDRRLTMPADGRIVSERSNKMTIFQCVDAHGVITYNGIGSDFSGKSPNDWIAVHPEIGSLTLEGLISTIKVEADKQLNILRPRVSNPRHTYIIAGYRNGQPFVICISNYESVSDEERLQIALPELRITSAFSRRPDKWTNPFFLVITGAMPAKPSRLIARIGGMFKDGATPRTLRKQMVKAVRDVAYEQGLKGTVGTSVQSVIGGPDVDFEVAGHIPGGTTLLESPNFVGKGMSVRDVYIDINGSGQFKSRYDPKSERGVIEEGICKCGAPVPEGYRRCGVCGAPK